MPERTYLIGENEIRILKSVIIKITGYKLPSRNELDSAARRISSVIQVALENEE